MVDQKTDERGQRDLISEFGLRPLRAVGSRYEPEAIGVYAYAPVGMANAESEKSSIRRYWLFVIHY